MRKTLLIGIIFLLVNNMTWAQKIEFKKVSAKTFQSLILEDEDNLLIDVSSKIDFEEARIQGAICAETSQKLFSILDTTPENLPVLIYCTSGERSFKACWLIKERYPHQVYTLKGGMAIWEKKGFSIESSTNK
jgi:rhodanese-related sulfurtransferase